MHGQWTTSYSSKTADMDSGSRGAEVSTALWKRQDIETEGEHPSGCAG